MVRRGKDRGEERRDRGGGEGQGGGWEGQGRRRVRIGEEEHRGRGGRSVSLVVSCVLASSLPPAHESRRRYR